MTTPMHPATASEAAGQQLLAARPAPARASLLFRLKCGLAGLCLAGAILCIWAAAGIPFPFSGAGIAAAGSEPGNSGESDSSTQLRKMLLQASVDSAALGISGILDNLPDAEAKRNALAAALDSLTFDLGAPVYFTAWEQTRLLHSPLTPDTENMDFADALDSRGVAFVRALSGCLENGGGFVQVLLPRQNFDRNGHTTQLPEQQTDPQASPHMSGSSVAIGQAVNATGGISLAVSPLYMTPVAPRVVEEIQIVYTRAIPNSQWHISAFMAAPEEDAARGPANTGSPSEQTIAGSAFATNANQPISVWQSTIMDDKDAAAASDADLRKGLTVSGLSLLGIAGVLISPRRRG